MPVPAAGCVVRFWSAQEAETTALSGPLKYHLPVPLFEAVQTGPMLVEDGRSTRARGQRLVSTDAMTERDALPDTTPPSPYDWKADWDQTRAARLAAGLSLDGGLFFCAVEGTSSVRSSSSARGATLNDLVELMIDEGAAAALHLDGGGSTQVFGPGGGALVTPQDVHHGLSTYEAQYDRPVPVALKLT